MENAIKFKVEILLSSRQYERLGVFKVALDLRRIKLRLTEKTLHEAIKNVIMKVKILQTAHARCSDCLISGP